MEVARFRMNDRGVRMPKTGDPVVNKKGQAIGYVTSAAVDVDGIILGLAYVGSRYARPGDEIGIFNVPARPVVEKAQQGRPDPRRQGRAARCGHPAPALPGQGGKGALAGGEHPLQLQPASDCGRSDRFRCIVPGISEMPGTW